MRNRTAWVLLILVAALLAGCASIPLGTMWELRNFEPEDLARLDPAGIRVATLIEPGPQRIDPARSQLTIRLAPRDGGEDEVHAFGLQLSDGGDSALPPGGRASGWEGLASMAPSRFLWSDPDHAAFGSVHGLRGKCLSLAHSR